MTFSLKRPILILTVSAVIAVVVCGMLLLITPAVEAKSIIDNQNVPGTLKRPPVKSAYGNACNVTAVENANVQVLYSANVINKLTRTKLADGAVIPKGTKLSLEFKDFEYTDIYWFGTGDVFDSPYGEWLPQGQKPPEICDPKDLILSVSDANSAAKLFVPFVVVPPAQSFSGLDGLTCNEPEIGGRRDAYIMECVVTGETGTTINPTFNFAQTQGNFYARVYGLGTSGSFFGRTFGQDGACLVAQNDPPLCIDDGSNSGNGNSPTYVHTIPAKSIPFTFTIGEGTTGGPTAPQITAVATACDTYTVTVTGTDSGDKRIRYGFDWNNNGTVDEWMPSLGYVASGASVSVARTWRSTDLQFVKVVTQNEDGVNSAWTEQTFAIDSSGLCNKLGVTLTATPSLIARGMTSVLTWKTTGSPRSCSASTGGTSFRSSFGTRSISGSSEWSGSKSVTGGSQNVTPNITTTYSITCSDATSRVTDTAEVRVVSCLPKPAAEWSCVDTTTYDNGCAVLTCPLGTSCMPGQNPICNTGSMSIEATPALVRKGNPSQIEWRAPLDTCTVTGNGDSWTGVSGSEQTSPINSQVDYTLSCPGIGDMTATVKVLPSIIEF